MKVAVVGAGAAGLRAAMLLQRAGVEVSLFEARDRIGGRIRTMRGPRACEAGAEWIDADHFRVLALLEELGLGLARPRNDLPGLLIHRGEIIPDAELWPDAAEDERRFEAAARALCAGLVEPPWTNQNHADLDQRRLVDFIDEHARSERGKWWLAAKYRSDEGDEPDRIGLLGWLCGYLHYLSRGPGDSSTFRVEGGWDSLLTAMADRIAMEPCLRARLVSVRQDQSGVELTFAQPARTWVERADRAILTLPPRALEQVTFDPPLGSAKSAAIGACRMSRVIKICLEFKRAWWLDEGWSGRMLCDGPLQQTWDGTIGERPVLMAYICGNASLPPLGDASCAERRGAVDLALVALTRMFPKANRYFVGGAVHDWNADPYSQGGFSHLAPGFVLTHMRHIAPAEGRLHFAGEHTGLYTGFVEGALESAERVAQEVLDSMFRRAER